MGRFPSQFPCPFSQRSHWLNEQNNLRGKPVFNRIAAPSKSTFIAVGLAVLGLGYGMHPPTTPAQAADASQRTVTVVGFGRV